MAHEKGLPEIVGELYALLEPLESENRLRVIASAMTLLGEQPISNARTKVAPASEVEVEGAVDASSFGIKAARWMSQHGISMATIEEVFHSDGGTVEVIASEIPGSGKRGQSLNCYLLEGIRGLLSTDEPKFTDSGAVSLCKAMGCYDAANHAKTRNELGNNVAGSKNSGFTLPAPGLRAAASLVKSMSA